MFETSETTEKLDAALAQAQAEICSVVKDAVNPHFRSGYATLSAVIEASRKALSRHGVSVTQWPVASADDKKVVLVTRLACQGQWMRATFSAPVDKVTAQGYGSGLSYLRRYSLMAALNMAANDDDDGNAAEPAPEPKTVKAVKAADPAPKAKAEATPQAAKEAKQGPYMFPAGPHAGKRPDQLDASTLDAYLSELLKKMGQAGKTIDTVSPEMADALKALKLEQSRRLTQHQGTWEDDVP